jgi:hypothetical protein
MVVRRLATILNFRPRYATWEGFDERLNQYQRERH